MPLQKQSVSVSFAQGVDTKTDPKQVIQGKLLQLENGIFINPQRITKRNGYATRGRAGTVGSGLASFDDELLAFDNSSVRSLAPSMDAFESKGSAVSCEVSNHSVISNDYAQTSQDGCYHPIGIKTFVWEDGRGGIRYSVIDAETRQQIVSDTQVVATGSRPKVFALGNYVIIVYYDDTNSLDYKRFSCNTPATLSSAVSICTTISTTYPIWDGVVIGDRIFFVWNSTYSTTSVNVCYMTATLVIGAAYVGITSQNANIAAAIWGDTNQRAWVAFYNGTAIQAFVVDYNATAYIGLFTWETVANVVRLTGYETAYQDQTINASTVIYEVSATNTYDHFVRRRACARYNTTPALGTAAEVVRSVGIASKIFSYNGLFYAVLAYESSLQPTYFVVNIATGLIVAKVSAQVGGGLPKKAILPNVEVLSSSEFMLPLLEKTRLDSQSGVLFSLTGVIDGTISFLSMNTFLRASMAGNLHITGGILSMYDGVSVCEHGFNVYPEMPGTTIATTTGGIGAGTRQYQVCYEWTDNKGNIHRSAPCTPVTVITVAGSLSFTGTLTSGSKDVSAVSSLSGLFVGQSITGSGIPPNTYIATLGAVNTLTITNAATSSGNKTITTTDTNKVTLAIPTLRLTAKRASFNRSEVVLSVYRTQNASTTFYKVSSISSPTFNVPTSDTVNFVDTMPDFYINGNELLYTTGGVVENVPVPSVSLISTYKTRLVVVPSENKRTYWISKDNISGSPVEFSDYFVKRIDDRDGDITAVAQMDANLILFKENTVWLTSGDGPDDTGTQDDLTKPQLITTDAGCNNPRSVAVTPAGLIRQSGKGIYLLNRSLQDTYIGAEVEKYNSDTITSSTLVPNTNQIRFTTTSGVCLVYDYLFGQWSVFTNHRAVDATVFEKLFTFIDASGNVYQETVGTYLDNGLFIPLKLKTSWLSFAGLQGFQRVYQAIILGEYKSPHRLIGTVAYDFNENPEQQTYIDSSILGIYPMGEDGGTYGEESPMGGAFPLYQFRLFMAKQKCQTVQLGLQEVQDSDYGEGLSISAFNFLVGMKSGTFKLPASRSFG